MNVKKNTTFDWYKEKKINITKAISNCVQYLVKQNGFVMVLYNAKKRVSYCGFLRNNIKAFNKPLLF